MGHLNVITGSMYGGKSLLLIEDIKRWKYMGLDYMVFSPIKDEVTSRGAKESIPAIHIDRSHASIISYQVGVAINEGRDIKKVAIDEVSFYDPGVIQAIEALLGNGIDVVVAGLDQDFRGKPFGSIGYLMAIATHVTKYHSICMKCRSALATKTQRLLDGKPSPLMGQLIIVDNSSEHYTYECRCPDCYERG